MRCRIDVLFELILEIIQSRRREQVGNLAAQFFAFENRAIDCCGDSTKADFKLTHVAGTRAKYASSGEIALKSPDFGVCFVRSVLDRSRIIVAFEFESVGYLTTGHATFLTS